jgi:glycosyltransferase involved in cell wall biosynthesis/thymidylate kinase
MLQRESLKQSSDLLKSIIAIIQGGSLEKKVDDRIVIHLLKRNSYPLLGLKQIPSTESFSRAFEAEKIRYEIQREEFLKIQDKFKEADIHPVLFKGGGIIPSFPYTSENLDVLIGKAEVISGRKILNDLGYIELKNIEEPEKYLFKRFVNGEVRMALHLHSQIGWGVPFLALEEEGRKAPDDSQILLPSPESGCLITFAHSLYENKGIRLLDLLQVHNWAREGLKWKSMLDRAYCRGWGDGFTLSLSLYGYLEKSLLSKTYIPKPDSLESKGRAARHTPKRIVMPLPISFIYSKILYYKKIWRDRERDLSSKMRDTLSTFLWGIELKLKIRSQPPMLIAFSGIDGSGKTSHSKNLKKAFNECGLRTHYVWNRYGSSLFVGWLIKLGKILFMLSRSDNDSKKIKWEKRKFHLKRSWIRTLWQITVFLELTLKYLIQVKFPLLFGWVVVCDRYLLDALAEMSESLNHPEFEQSLFGLLLRKLNPKPSQQFLLDISPKTAVERTKIPDEYENTGSLITRYRDMGSRYNYKLINGEAPFETVSNETILKTLSTYYKNFGTFIKGLLCVNPSQLNPEIIKRKKMKVLMLTNMYPHKDDPVSGIFVKEQVDSLRALGVDIDILFINGIKSRANYFRGIFEFLRKIHQNQYSLIHAHHTYCALIGKLQNRIPLLLTFHEGEINKGIGIVERIRNYGIWKIPIFSQRLKRWTGKQADKIISVFPEGGPLLGREDAFVIPCGIDLHLFKPIPLKGAKRKLNLPLNEKILLFSADPSRKEKRYDIARDAYQIVKKKIPSLRLVPLSGIQRNHLPLYMNSADLMILTSDFEASPMVIKEAMAVNLPILSVDVGDVAELIKNTKGCFISPRNPESLALKIEEIIANGFPRTNGREKILHLDNEKIARKIYSVYKEMVHS